MKTKTQLLAQARAFAKARFEQLRPPMTATLEKARKDLTALCAASGTHEAMGTPLSKAFVEGLAEVLTGLRSFQSGYASNDVSQHIDPKAIPGFAETNMVKAEGSDVAGPDVQAFVKHAASVINGADALPINEALDALTALIVQIDKGELPVHNDPAALVPTIAAGTTAPAGTSSASTAPTNFATNPDAIGGPAPSGSAGTSGVAATAASTGNGDEPANVPATAGAGAAASTSGVAALAASGGGAAQEMTKALGDNPLEDLNKAAPKPFMTSWTQDLNSREFMTGQRKHDFGKDGTKV